MLVFGTRPEAIKMAPLVKEFQKHPESFETIVCVTGQHHEHGGRLGRFLPTDTCRSYRGRPSYPQHL